MTGRESALAHDQVKPETFPHPLSKVYRAKKQRLGGFDAVEFHVHYFSVLSVDRVLLDDHLCNPFGLLAKQLLVSFRGKEPDLASQALVDESTEKLDALLINVLEFA